MSSHRSLWPREHGAYAQLATPLVASLLVRSPAPAALWLALGAVCAFLANEPLLVALGHRGAKLRATDGARARRRLVVLGGVAVGAGVWGLYLASHRTLEIAAVAAVPAVALLLFAYRRAQHSLVGELVAAIALPAASAPVAVASGVSVRVAVLLWSTWAVGYACSVVGVHRVIARHRRPAAAVDRVLAVALPAATCAVAALAASLRIASVALPLLAVSSLLVIRPPGAKRLRAVGVALVAASLVSLCLVIAIA